MSCDAVLVGRMANNVNSIRTKNDKVMHCFTVASTRGFGDKQEVDWFDCIAFAPALDKQAEFMKKGSMVKLVGHLASRKYMLSDVQKKVTSWNFIVDSCEFIRTGKKKEEKKTDEQSDDYFVDEFNASEYDYENY